MVKIGKLILSLGMIGIGFLQIGWAQGVPFLEEIVSQVRKASLPAEVYRVDVIQSYFQGKVEANKQDEEDAEHDAENTSALEEPKQQSSDTVEQSIFSVHYDPSKGYSTSKKVDPQAQPDGIPGLKSSSLQPANERFNVNLVKLLNILSSTKEAPVVLKSMNGRPIYRILAQGRKNELSYLAGIDGESWYVKTIVISMDQIDFYQVEIEYRKVNEQYWLPPPGLQSDSFIWRL
jgi:hypothetical protein